MYVIIQHPHVILALVAIHRTRHTSTSRRLYILDPVVGLVDTDEVGNLVERHLVFEQPLRSQICSFCVTTRNKLRMDNQLLSIYDNSLLPFFRETVCV